MKLYPAKLWLSQNTFLSCTLLIKVSLPERQKMMKVKLMNRYSNEANGNDEKKAIVSQ